MTLKTLLHPIKTIELYKELLKLLRAIEMYRDIKTRDNQSFLSFYKSEKENAYTKTILLRNQLYP
jgi:hypothetical protein